MSAAAATVWALLVVISLLALAIGAVLLRRRISTDPDRTRRRRRGHVATSLGRELFGRSLRIDAVLENVRQAVTLAELSSAPVRDRIGELAARLEEECELQREQLAEVAPLTGESRSYALGLVDPRISALEQAGRAVLDLAREASYAQTDVGASDSVDALRREASALEAALEELGSPDQVRRQIEGLAQGGPA